MCRGPRRVGYAECFSCSRVLAQVSRPCRRVAPVSLYELGSPLHRALRAYKDGGSPGVRARYTSVVVGLLAGFLAAHASCVGAGASPPWDLATTVPSTSGAVPHPLEQVLATVPWLKHRRSLVRTAVALGHLRAHDRGFEVSDAVQGQRVLVLDDTWTSGARAQSAASALAVAGAVVVAVVPLGRFVDPTWSPRVARWWSRRADLAFDVGSCCLGPPVGAARAPAHRGAGNRGAA